MTERLLIVLLLAFMCSFPSLYAVSWKKSGTKEVNRAAILQLGSPFQPNRIDPSRVIQLSQRPRVFLYKGFLSDAECDYLISQGSEIEENALGIGNDSTKDDIKEMIEERISAWTFLPKENSYPLRVLHFELEVARQNYEYFGRNSTLLLNEPLAATVVLYLSDVSQGGQILFPKLEQESSQSRNNIWSDCTKSSNTLRPTKGNAILFFNTHPNASPDMSSSHARCPVNEGEMWCATKFFYLRAITKGKVPLQSDNSDCIDEDDNCLEWAAAGECQKNPVFMIGTSDYYGTCRKSCNVC